MGKRFSILNLGIGDRELDTAVADCMKDLDDQEQLTGQLTQSVSDFTPGAILKGKVVRIAGDDVVVDIGYKSEGFIDKMEFDDIKVIEQSLAEEAVIELEVYLDQIEDASGLVVLSKKKADRIRGWERVMETYKVGDVVKGKATRKIKGGLLVDIGVPVFLPASQIDIRRVGDPQDWVGRELECKIIKIDNERRNIVLSRRKMLEDERDRMKKDLLSNIQKGEVRRGVVKNITDFGAFIDLGGIDGLLHITDMSWGRIQHPSEVLKVDQSVEVKVLDYDLDRERISLGLKQLSPNPWSLVAEKYPVGTRHKGEVVNIMPYGAFVKLEDGIEGLVHVSEMSWTRNIQHPNEVVALGQEVEVVVLDVNQDKQEISLGMKQAEENPWTNVEEKYPPGTQIKGKVRNMTTYGAFVELEDGIDGLLHVSDMSWTKKITHPSAMLKKGDEVEAVVLSVDKDRKRVALGLKQLSSDPWETDIPGRFKPGQKVKGAVTKLTSFGAFVEIGEDLEGLLHISEMSDGKIEKPEEIVQPGQTLELKILNVDPTERKIGLSLKAMSEDGVELPPEQTASVKVNIPEETAKSISEREEKKDE
ncbi:MAG: 30S ribosomal protein S1 [Planctomycetota bacterium]|nr:30S ribosomal protein S1 [Planctomycetota bacterium]